jgi:hypothetical protein
MTAWSPGVAITAAALNDGIDATIVTTGFTPATGWAVSDFNVATSGKVVEVNVYLNRSGAAITNTAGNISDTAAGTLPAGVRPTRGTINGFWDNGTAAGGFVVGTDGVMTLRTSNGQDIASGSNLRLHIVFIL